MITFTVTGTDDLAAFLKAIAVEIASDELWTASLSEMMEKGRAFAQGISPVVTGSYKRAHEVVLSERGALLRIDPMARNSGTGGPVIGYAGAVEARYSVYGQVGAYIDSLVEATTQVIAERITDGG